MKEPLRQKHTAVAANISIKQTAPEPNNEGAAVKDCCSADNRIPQSTQPLS